MTRFRILAALLALALVPIAHAQTISSLPALATAPADGDLLLVVDVSDTPPAAGKNKRITVANLLAYTGEFGGNAATATALAGNPADCSAGQYATTIAASGALTCAQVNYSQLAGTVPNAPTATALAANGANCSAGQAPLGVDASGAVEGCFAPSVSVPLTLTYDDASTNTVLAPLVLTRTSSGTAAAGIGGAVDYILENASGTNRTYGRTAAVSIDSTNATEDGELQFYTMLAGSLERVGLMYFSGTQTAVLKLGKLSNPQTEISTGNYNGELAVTGGNAGYFNGNSLRIQVRSDGGYGWSSTTTNNGDSTVDAVLRRNSAGVIRCGDDTANSIRCLLGGGASVASATALPVPTGRVFHVTGTTTITSITSTNFESGACVTLIFDGVLTFTDGGNLKLAGDFTTSADDTISLCYDGSNWHETGRSVN